MNDLRKLVAAATALLLALALASAARAMTTDLAAPTVATDRADYAPGDTVTVTGAGWSAGETVQVTVNDTDGQTWSWSGEAVAADDGTFSVALQLPDVFISDYTVTATGAVASASTTFTDAAALTVTTGTKTTAFNTSPSFNGVAVDSSPVTLTARLGSTKVVGEVTVTPTCGGKGGCNYGPVSFATLGSDGDITVTATEASWTGKPPTVSFFLDRVAPKASISFPVDGATYSHAAFSCSGDANICGGVFDPPPSSGFGAQVAIRRSDGTWWNGVSFVRSGGPIWRSAGTFWTSPFSPQDGTFTAFARGTDKAGNIGPEVQVRFTIAGDTTPPTLTLSQHPNGANGWFTTAPATLKLKATDDSSGTASIDCTLDGSPVEVSNLVRDDPFLSGTVATSVDGIHFVSCTAVDRAGNRTDVQTAALMLDTTPPHVTLTVSGTLGRDGWYVSDVTLTTTGWDDVSGISGCTGVQTITLDTPGQFVVGICSNGAGLMEDAELVVKRDATPPDVWVTGVEAGASYVRGAAPAAGCATRDHMSGVAAEASVAVTGGTVNAVGPYTATCSGAQDVAGNVAAPVSAGYTVIYGGVSGILQPINPDGTSVFSRGGSVPVKLALAGDEGTSGYDTSVWTIRRVPATCTGTEGDDEVVGSNTPYTTFRYDASADQYIYNADFRDQAAGTCWRVRVTLDSGQVLSSALFRLR